MEKTPRLPRPRQVAGGSGAGAGAKRWPTALPGSSRGLGATLLNHGHPGDVRDSSWGAERVFGCLGEPHVPYASTRLGPGKGLVVECGVFTRGTGLFLSFPLSHAAGGLSASCTRETPRGGLSSPSGRQGHSRLCLPSPLPPPRP